MYIDGKVIPTGTLVVYPLRTSISTRHCILIPGNLIPLDRCLKATSRIWDGGEVRPHSAHASFFETEVDDVSLLIFLAGSWGRESSVPRLAIGDAHDQAPRRAGTRGFRL
jgi:hypothetical protein